MKWPDDRPISEALAHLPGSLVPVAQTVPPARKGACRHLGRRVRLDDGSVKKKLCRFG